MTETKTLAAALAAFQGEVTAVAKSKTADAGQFAYRYADLASIAETAYPLLAKHGLAFTCRPRPSDRGYEVVGVLLHESGESIKGSLPLYGTNPQQLGSSLTYARRYLLGSLTGIVTEEDDDGQQANAAPRTPSRGRTDVRRQRSEQPMTDRTRGEMFALFNEQGIAEDAQRAGIAAVIGRQIESRADLTEAEARQVIDALRHRPKPTAEPTAEPELDGPLIGGGE